MQPSFGRDAAAGTSLSQPRQRLLAARLVALLAEERADVGERAEVAQLVGVNDGADRLHDAVGDVEREDVDDPLLGVEQDRAGLAVHLVQLDADAQAGELASPAGEEAADTVAADDRARPGRRLAAAVAVDDDIR